MLLLFDNFEQVVEAAADAAALLGSCPGLDLLVTSREPLHLSGEYEFPVPPLSREEGVGLFLARARAVKPDFQVDEAISEICRRLDDLPLALELAAARVRALSSAEILERLEERLPLLTGGARDLPERQRTLRAAIQWSYELLEHDERRLFARLAVFRGGCTLESAEEVAEADLDALQSLVDKSLLRRTADRFWMLETIREYADAQLREGGEEDATRARHLDHYPRSRSGHIRNASLRSPHGSDRRRRLNSPELSRGTGIRRDMGRKRASDLPACWRGTSGAIWCERARSRTSASSPTRDPRCWRTSKRPLLCGVSIAMLEGRRWRSR